RSDLRGDLAALAHRYTHDHKIGTLDRRRVGLGHLIGDAEFGDAPARRARARCRRDRPYDAGVARGTRDRRADQAHADQRQTIEYRVCAHAAALRKSPSAATTSRFASSVPTDKRNALGSL